MEATIMSAIIFLDHVMWTPVEISLPLIILPLEITHKINIQGGFDTRKLASASNIAEACRKPVNRKIYREKKLHGEK